MHFYRWWSQISDSANTIGSYKKIPKWSIRSDFNGITFAPISQHKVSMKWNFYLFRSDIIIVDKTVKINSRTCNTPIHAMPSVLWWTMSSPFSIQCIDYLWFKIHMHLIVAELWRIICKMIETSVSVRKRERNGRGKRAEYYDSQNIWIMIDIWNNKKPQFIHSIIINR